MTKLPRIFALLSWYDESPLWLTAAITSCAPFVDHVVALDGAYALYPHGEARSRVDQAQSIVETCHAAGLGFTLHGPQYKWFGNEVAKRTHLFRLAEQEAEPNVDWYFVLDADIVVDRYPDDLKHQLAHTQHDVAQVTVWERGDPYRNPARLEHESMVPLPPDSTYPIRCLFRAIPGLHVTGNHYQYVTGDGRMLWGHALDPKLEPGCLNLHNGLFRMEHRTHYRPKQRHMDAWEYYNRRDATHAETQPGAVTQANQQAKQAARNAA